MELEIPEEIINQTQNCQKEYNCLSNCEQTVCPPVNNIGGKILFIKTRTRNSCPYKMSFGNSFICNCPVRKEIHKRYQL